MKDKNNTNVILPLHIPIACSHIREAIDWIRYIKYEIIVEDL